MMCEKVAYPDKITALNSCRGISLSRRTRQSPVRAYKCDDCGKWHITSQKTKPKDITTSKIELQTVEKAKGYLKIHSVHNFKVK